MGTCLTVGALTGCSGSGSSAPETTAPAAEQSGSGTAEAAEGGGEAKTEAAAQSGEKNCRSESAEIRWRSMV